MPRKSAAALLTLVNPDRPPRLVPPDDLAAAERKIDALLELQQC